MNSDARKGFHDELESLQQDLLRMGRHVEESISRAVEALSTQNLQLAEQVIDDDDEIDEMQVYIENNCLRLLALQQPMGKDLRVIGTALKVVTDIERIADHSVDICRTVTRMNGEPLVKPLIDIPRMAHIAQKMVRDSLKSFVARDTAIAESLAKQDDDVDYLFGSIMRELTTLMMADTSTIRQSTHLMMAAQSLERIGDHATNIGEWVIYMVLGERRDLNV